MKECKINNDITSNIIRLKDTNEVIPKSEALKRTNGLDLIEISTYNNGEQISVCIIQDYQKFQYQQKRKEKEIKANQFKIIVKEIKFGPRTDDHDYNFKLKQARKFIEDKNKVKAFVLFKGRELNYQDQGELILLRLANDLSDIAKVEVMPKLEGKRMNIIIVPK